MLVKKILTTFLLMPIIIMIMSGCSSQAVTSTPTVTPTVTATKTVTATPTASPLQQQAINFVKIHLIELTGATGAILAVNFDELDSDFKWSAIAATQDPLHPPYLVSASYIYGPITDTIGTWLFDPTSGNVTPVDSKTQKAEEQVKLLKNTIALVPTSGTTQPSK
jgi:hypothetical protein